MVAILISKHLQALLQPEAYRIYANGEVHVFWNREWLHASTIQFVGSELIWTEMFLADMEQNYRLRHKRSGKYVQFKEMCDEAIMRIEQQLETIVDNPETAVILVQQIGKIRQLLQKENYQEFEPFKEGEYSEYE